MGVGCLNYNSHFWSSCSATPFMTLFFWLGLAQLPKMASMIPHEQLFALLTSKQSIFAATCRNFSTRTTLVSKISLLWVSFPCSLLEHRPQLFYKVHIVGRNWAAHHTIRPAYNYEGLTYEVSVWLGRKKQKTQIIMQGNVSYNSEVISGVINPIEASKNWLIWIQDNLEGNKNVC